jgi:hypothetical protein
LVRSKRSRPLTGKEVKLEICQRKVMVSHEKTFALTANLEVPSLKD